MFHVLHIFIREGKIQDFVPVLIIAVMNFSSFWLGLEFLCIFLVCVLESCFEN